MLKILSPKIQKTEVKKPLTIQEIEKFYLEGIKPDNLVGLEYERLSLDKHSFQNAKYENLEKIIEHFAKIMDWELVRDNDTIIGAKNQSASSISLEPGMQLELSLEPKGSIAEIEKEAKNILNLLDKIADIYDVIFLPYGVSPVSEAEDIKILNKERYKIMNNYLPECSGAAKCPDMMRRSAGIQINIDYSSRRDCFKKVLFFNLIMPYVTAMCSNSPFEYNKMTNCLSNRAAIWLNVGYQRCNVFYKNIFKKMFFRENDIFKNYINEILDVPMVYIVRGNKNIELFGKITFREFMKQGYFDFSAEMDDYILHQSLCFPDIRLKNYIEIRNHDSGNIEIALALCAFYKGLNLCNIAWLLKKFRNLKPENIQAMALKAPYGYGSEFNNEKGWSVMQKLLEISKSNLEYGEAKYLEPLFEIVHTRKTPAHRLQEAKIKDAQDLAKFINKY